MRRQSGHVVAMHNGKIINEDVHSEGTQLAAILTILEAQAPKLYREIMDYQEELNPAFRQHFPQSEARDVISAHQRQFHAVRSSVTSPLQEREEGQQGSPKHKLLPIYTFFKEHISHAPLHSLMFDPMGKEILYGAQTEGLHRLEVAALRPINSLKTSRALTSLAFNQNGTYFASGTDDGTLILWQRAASEPIRYKTLQAHSDWVTEVTFSADGRYVVSGSDDGSLCLLEITARNSQIVRKPQGIRTLACHPQQDLWVSCHMGQDPSFWQITPQHDTDLPEVAGEVLCLRFSPDGRYFVCGKAEGQLVVYNTHTWSPIVLPMIESKAIRCLAFHPQDPLLASGGDDDKIQLWNILTGQHVQTLTRHVNRITGLSFSPDGDLLASAGRDGRLVVWRVFKGEGR